MFDRKVFIEKETKVAYNDAKWFFQILSLKGAKRKYRKKFKIII